MKVLLADDQRAVRSALRLLLEQGLALHVAGEAADVVDLLAAVETGAPDLVLLDWELPGLYPGALAALRRAAPGLAVIALSSRPEARAAALAAGADGFVSKGDPPDALLGALHLLHGRKASVEA